MIMDLLWGLSVCVRFPPLRLWFTTVRAGTSFISSSSGYFGYNSKFGMLKMVQHLLFPVSHWWWGAELNSRRAKQTALSWCLRSHSPSLGERRGAASVKCVGGKHWRTWAGSHMASAVTKWSLSAVVLFLCEMLQRFGPLLLLRHDSFLLQFPGSADGWIQCHYLAQPTKSFI